MFREYKCDLKRNDFFSYVGRFLFFLRLAQSARPKFLRGIISVLFLRHYVKKYGLEIPYTTQIGEGFYLGHAFNITINGDCIIGKNCNIHKGAVVGCTNRGEKKGVPKIGDNVWIGINAAIVGNINIGDDVLIAPNSYVNIDIPSHSVVLGNPCIIKHRDNATAGYIENVGESC